MTNQPVITLILGLLTILFSGVVSAFVTFRLNLNKDHTQFMRLKAEALYLAADEYARLLGSHAITYFPVITGEMDWNQMLDGHIASGSQERQHGGAETMTMLVEIYFPTVRPALAEVFEARDSFNKLTAQLKRTYKQSYGELDAAAWMPMMMAETTKIDASIKKLQSAIIVAARSFAGVKHSQAPSLSDIA